MSEYTTMNDLYVKQCDFNRAIQDLGRRLDKVAPVGKPGNGTCICPASPEQRLQALERMREPLSSRYTTHNDPILDHRCPIHGEKAQPALWGRHRELQLSVTFRQWESLGVTHTNEAPQP